MSKIESKHLDEIITIEERKINVPQKIKNIAVQNDHNSEIAKIVIPRYFDGHDLSAYSIMLKAVSRGGRADVLFTEREIQVLDEEIELTWILKLPITSFSGIVKIQITIFGEDFKWQTESAEVNIVKSLDAQPIIPNQLDFVEKFVLQMEEKMGEVETILGEVKADVEIIEGNLNTIGQVVEEVHQTEENIKGYTQQNSQYVQEVEQDRLEVERNLQMAQEIKNSTEVFYDINEEEFKVGFRRANEDVFTYTPSLKGEKGDTGERGEQGETGNGWLFGTADPLPTYGKDGDLYIQTSSYDIFKKKNGAWVEAGNIKGAKGDTGETGLQGERGEQGIQGIQGVAGADGREIELRRHDIAIQYRYKGEDDSAWKNVVKLEYIKGDKGDKGDTGEQGVAGKNIELQKTSSHIQWKNTGDGVWNDLVPLSELQGLKGETGLQGERGEQGENGREIELQKSETHIQWRYIGEPTWTNLVALDDLRGEGGGGEGVAGERGFGWIVGEANPIPSQGRNGDLYLNSTSYEIFEKRADSWVSMGVIKGTDGREIELQKSETHIQWKYSNEETWKNIVELDQIKGQAGTNGKNIELQKTDTHIQWRYVGEVGWQNLVELTALRGDNGVPIQIMRNSTHIKWKYENEEAWKFLISLDELKGEQGLQGESGKNIELQKTSTHIQWRNVGEVEWQNLVPLYEIKGDTGAEGLAGRDGAKGEKGDNGTPIEIQKSATHIQWRYVGEMDWRDLIYLGDLQGEQGERGLQGESGKNIELQKTSTHIQWRVQGQPTWNDLVSLLDLKGDKGDKGEQGESGSSSVTIQKEPIVLTPKSGYTIVNQDTCKIGDILYINVEIKKTDGSYLNQGNYLEVAECPLLMKNTALPAIGSISNWFKIPSSGYTDENTIVVIPTKDCVSIRVSGEVIL